MSGYGTKFPPKNRRLNDMGPIDIEIAGSGGTMKFDPNDLLCAVMEDELFAALGDPLDDATSRSLLSEKPGYRYADSEVEFVLERKELLRFLLHDLLPGEYFRLRDEFGMFFSIHDDFYHGGTGAALQPIEAPEETNAPH